jgi:WD40 repeat protein
MSALVGAILLTFPHPSPAQDRAAGVDRHGDPLPQGAIARIGTLRFRQASAAYSVAFSPDGRFIAVGGSAMPSNSTTTIFEARTGKVVRQLPGHAHVVSALAFARDGSLLVSGGGDATLSVWDLARGQRLWQSGLWRKGPWLGRETVAFLPDGKTVAADEDVRHIRLCDGRTGKPGRLLQGHTDRVFHITSSPSGKHLASCAVDGTVRVWEVATGKEVRRFQVADKYGLSVAFAPDGTRLACGTVTGAVYLWDVATGARRWRFRKGDDVAASVAFSPDGAEVYTIRQELRVLDAATGKERRRFPLPQMMRHLALAPDGAVAALIGDDGEVRLFDPVRGRFLARREGHARGVRSVAFSADGRSLATASGESVFRIWDVATGRPERTFAGKADSVAFAPDGGSLVTGSLWEGASLWDAATGKRLRTFRPDGPGPTAGVRLSGGRPLLVAGTAGERLIFWEAATGKLHPHSFTSQLDPTASFRPVLPYALSPDGSTAAVLPDLAAIEPVLLWDFRKGLELRRTAVRGTPVAFSPDGRLLAIRATDGFVLVDTKTGKEARRIRGPAASVQDIAFSPDGHMLATAGNDGMVRLWETVSGQQRRVFKGHGQRVLCVAFSPDGTRLASGSEDLTALVWDVYASEAKAP